MPVVPFSPVAAGQSAAKPKPIPKAQEPWLLMAAATMDTEGRLVEAEEEEIDDK
jgi:hypothetical protein